MKKNTIFLLMGAATLITASSCSDFLTEKPRASLNTEYFKSVDGVNSGLTSVYSSLRGLYGQEGQQAQTIVGTDEATFGGDGGASNLNNYGATYFNNGGAFWGTGTFTPINTCNAIVQFGAGVGRGDLIAEARFLRAHLYYLIANHYGGAPLDLGAGKLAYNTVPTTNSTRNSAIEVYQSVVDDLTYAFNNLPVTTSSVGRATKAAAAHFLAKTYLTIANYYQYDFTNELSMGGTGSGSRISGNASLLNSQTYTPSVTKPDSAQKYYGLALQYAEELITNAASYGCGLLTKFEDVNKQFNESSSEVLFSVQHTNDNSYTYDESSAANYSFHSNASNWFHCCYYEAHAKFKNGGGTPLARSVEYGRGWRRFVPTKHLLNDVFTDKANDSRYFASFNSEYIANKNGLTSANKLDPTKIGVSAGCVNELNNTCKVGDLVMYLPGYEVSVSYDTTAKTATVTYIDSVPSVIKAKIQAAANAGARIWSPSEYTPNFFPTCNKFMDQNRADKNDCSHRPYIVAKLSETYLIAAEAALMTNDKPKAFGYIKTLRERAAVGSLVAQASGEATAKANIMAGLSAANVDLDLILAERSRELCLEQLRWFDLVRTDKLIDYVHTKKWNYYYVTSTRTAEQNAVAADNIRRFHYLHAIPKEQTDRMTDSTYIRGYQNPGY
jgi:hypothetical protein